jgi:DNA-binding GntR family transcriptional regulator
MTSPERAADPPQVVQIVERIRDAIRDGRYSPGQRLIESELTREFGVSRGPVREALGRLEVEGLVELARHRGASVRRMGRKDVLELLTVRELLQGGAARLAALNVDQGDNRARLKAALVEFRRWTRATEIVGYAEETNKLHDLILDIAGNDLLAETIQRLRIQAFRLLFGGLLSLERIRESAKGHVAIVTAILAGDPDAAENAMCAQLRRTGDQALELIDARDRSRRSAITGIA